MSIRVALTHRTRYRYERPVQLSPQLVRLRPAPHTRTPIVSYSLKIEPGKHFLNWMQDAHGNYQARLVYPEKVDHFAIDVDLVADLTAYNPFDFFLEPYVEQVPFTYPEALRADLAPFLTRCELTPKLAAFIEDLDRRQTRTVDFLVQVNRAVHAAVEYIVRLEPGYYTPEQTLALGRGSCRDSAWLLVQVMRHLGIAARFVSGYLIQLVPDELPIEGPPGPRSDFTDLHAWCECYVPGAGWIGLDATSGLLAAEGHIPLACTPTPESAAPVEGAVEKVETEFDFAMQVERIAEAKRPKKPLLDREWQRIVQLGEQVDDDLVRGDVRLTMGGEPTFVSVDAPDAPEWNTAALGGNKERLGERLLFRLYEAWAPGGLVHHGQGKWYPGEPLPRWTIACYFRTDGIPLWRDPKLIGRTERPLGFGVAEAERFVTRLAAHLGLADPGTMPAYEDVWYHLWRERRLPVNVDPLESRLDDELERSRLARVFRAGLGSIVGYVLPLRHDGAWTTGRWFFRDEHCFLLPGDSPMGFRLPLDSLPWSAPEDVSPLLALDPFASRPPLPERVLLPRIQRRSAVPESQPAAQQSAQGVVRTALCVQPRDGQLKIFLPPLATLEAFIELITAIELTAEQLRLPVQLEGYAPPHDPRVDVFKVGPDPGVLEVNVPKVGCFQDLVQQTQTLYEAARQEGLAPDKFEIDGTHVGAGGGHHLALGGATSADSPFLRRPDLLASLIAYFNNHPSLSYFFSGRFIGPTSQAPRTDEARQDALYEIDLALRQAGQQQSPLPWVVDRLFRNLLVDVTGNTHRAELCIDKLYSPDGPTGRLGLVELRGFEMAPHWQMTSLTQLLVRALVAKFWSEPYTHPPTRYGTAIHDRFLLPYFLERDLELVLDDLRRAGYAFDPAWFESQREFRFPRLGTLARDGLMMELRAALEPWPTLGEEATGSGQARYVDSSLERVQVLVQGLTPGRHSVTCNGVVIPLLPTGNAGEGVGAVRYRAWQPPSSLQPQLGVHTPLAFDLYDTWAERALFGCTYHVVHPGGRAHEERPVNAMAAESRRVARFDAFGHTPGRYELRRVRVRPEFPFTLDLRQAAVDRGEAVTLRQLARDA